MTTDPATAVRVLALGATPFLAAADTVSIGIQVVENLRHPDDLIPAALRAMPDVLVIDTAVPDLDLRGAVEELHRALPACCILALVRFDNDDDLDAALGARACSLVSKMISREELEHTVRRRYEDHGRFMKLGGCS
ncbi:hypothetical protein [Actinomadura sp. KC216]|uniref:hypothetical protein n=1 Tax=Actinomadura sp. KC216 TaxID=2530370 RepID=UPI00140464DB|nr:hypothetical protein [Actinomadura sp. KC216]